MENSEKSVSPDPGETTSVRDGRGKIRLFIKNLNKLVPPLPTSPLEQPLPQHGMIYFDHLYAEFQGRANKIEDADKATIKTVLEKRESGSLTWHDLYTFDLILTRCLTSEGLPRKIWSLRSRYRDVAGLREYEAYLASKPPDLEGKVKETDLRADIEYLLGQIHLRYATTPVKQAISDDISRRVTLVILIGVIIILLVVGFDIEFITASRPRTLLTVLFAGAMGGLLSMQQRYQSVTPEGDPIDNIAEMMQGWPRLFLPAISGGIFAILLYMLIIGGLIEGALFPTLADISSKGDGASLLDFIGQAIPATGGDYAKLIIWSFLAGFAERWVPDTLSQFVSKREIESTNSG